MKCANRHTQQRVRSARREACDGGEDAIAAGLEAGAALADELGLPRVEGVVHVGILAGYDEVVAAGVVLTRDSLKTEWQISLSSHVGPETNHQRNVVIRGIQQCQVDFLKCWMPAPRLPQPLSTP